MKGIIEASVYLVLFAIICMFSIDFIRINKDVSDASEVSQYVENYIEACCGDGFDNVLTESQRNAKFAALKNSIDNNNAVLSYGERKRTGDYEYIEYTFSYKLNAAMFGYSSWHEYKGLARYSITG